MNGDSWNASVMIVKESLISHASQRYLWVEENDPRGENVGGWVIDAKNPPAGQAQLLSMDRLHGMVERVLSVSRMAMLRCIDGLILLP